MPRMLASEIQGQGNVTQVYGEEHEVAVTGGLNQK
jgi:hypothetical protein